MQTMIKLEVKESIILKDFNTITSFYDYDKESKKNLFKAIEKLE